MSQPITFDAENNRWVATAPEHEATAQAANRATELAGDASVQIQGFNAESGNVTLGTAFQVNYENNDYLLTGSHTLFDNGSPGMFLLDGTYYAVVVDGTSMRAAELLGASLAGAGCSKEGFFAHDGFTDITALKLLDAQESQDVFARVMASETVVGQYNHGQILRNMMSSQFNLPLRDRYVATNLDAFTPEEVRETTEAFAIGSIPWRTSERPEHYTPPATPTALDSALITIGSFRNMDQAALVGDIEARSFFIDKNYTGNPDYLQGVFSSGTLTTQGFSGGLAMNVSPAGQPIIDGMLSGVIPSTQGSIYIGAAHIENTLEAISTGSDVTLGDVEEMGPSKCLASYPASGDVLAQRASRRG